MIIFLDFDGVLHPLHAEVDQLFCGAPHLWTILRQHREAQVVFSTSWRQQHPFDDLINFATFGGGEDLASRFIGCTPELDCDDDYLHRRLECEAWLADNDREGGPWLALDDMALLMGLGESLNVYIVDHRHGLREHDVEAVAARFARLCR